MEDKLPVESEPCFVPGCKQVYFCSKVGNPFWNQPQVAVRGTAVFGTTLLAYFFIKV